MSPDYANEGRRVLVTGPSGSGKTSWVLNHVAAFKGRILAFDHKGEFASRLGWRAVGTGPEIGQELAAGRPVAFNPHARFPGRLDDAFGLFCGLAFAVGLEYRGEKLVIIDELQNWLGTARGQLPEGLARILETGRCYHLDSVCIAQAGNLVNCRLRGQFTEAVAFQTTERNALDVLSTFGLDPEAVSGLGRLEYLKRRLREGRTFRGRLSFPASRQPAEPPRQLELSEGDPPASSRTSSRRARRPA